LLSGKTGTTGDSCVAGLGQRFCTDVLIFNSSHLRDALTGICPKTATAPLMTNRFSPFNRLVFGTRFADKTFAIEF